MEDHLSLHREAKAQLMKQSQYDMMNKRDQLEKDLEVQAVITIAFAVASIATMFVTGGLSSIVSAALFFGELW